MEVYFGYLIAWTEKLLKSYWHAILPSIFFSLSLFFFIKAINVK